MALVFEIIDFIKKQDEVRPITGDVLFMGKQETFGRTLELGENAKIHTLDWSPHFGADFVWDLGKPVPDDLKNRFDFIYDGGSLDNMWSPSQGLINMTDMLKPAGRMVCLACSSSFSWPYSMFSPGWFYDYFEVNKFSSYEVYLCAYNNEVEGLLRGPWSWHPTSEDPNKNRVSPPGRVCEWLVVSIAEKGSDTTSAIHPIQYQYRPPTEVGKQ